jgi:hypothetical protein
MEILLKDLAIAWRLADQSHSQQKPTLGKANDSISEAHPNRDTHASSNGGNTGVQAPWPPQEPGPILAQMTIQHSCQQVPKRQTPHRTAVRGWGPRYLFIFQRRAAWPHLHRMSLTGRWTRTCIRLHAPRSQGPRRLDRRFGTEP